MCAQGRACHTDDGSINKIKNNISCPVGIHATYLEKGSGPRLWGLGSVESIVDGARHVMEVVGSGSSALMQMVPEGLNIILGGSIRG